jgi:hypothetical protein
MAVRQRKVELAEVREGGEGRCGDAEGRSDRLLSKPVAGSSSCFRLFRRRLRAKRLLSLALE